jgi:hypothetical protein
LMEWYGGHVPSKGDNLAGDFRGYGFKEVFVLPGGTNMRVWLDDYMLSQSSAIEKLSDKCR